MIRVLIVDDSPTEVSMLKHIIESEKDMKVIGVAGNGKEAIEMTDQLKPDLITMDIQMPIMDGVEATRLIMSQSPTPIVVISSTVSDESIKSTFHLLEAGALTALAKPINVLSPSFEETRKHIVDTLRSMSEITVIRKPIKTKTETYEDIAKKFRTKSDHYEIVAIGASVGGPTALKTVLAKLPVDFPLPILIVQHMSNGFTQGFVQWLSENISLKVKEAQNHEILEKGTVYIAPEQHHLTLERIEGNLTTHLVTGNPVAGFYPSITVLFHSVAKVSGNKAIGILLTGMSDDGTVGLLEMKKAKAHTFVQDEESSVVFGMSEVALSMGAVDQIVELNHIAKYLTDLTS